MTKEKLTPDQKKNLFQLVSEIVVSLLRFIKPKSK